MGVRWGPRWKIKGLKSYLSFFWQTCLGSRIAPTESLQAFATLLGFSPNIFIFYIYIAGLAADQYKHWNPGAAAALCFIILSCWDKITFTALYQSILDFFCLSCGRVWFGWFLVSPHTQPTYAIKKLRCCQGRKWRWLANQWF